MTLRGLIEAVARGTDISATVAAAREAFPDPTTRRDILKACDGSLDAAKRLHGALLPGWDWSAGCVAGLCDAGVCKIGVEDAFFLARSDNPARAFLLAILRALEGEP